VRRVLADTGELFVDGLPPDYHHRYSSLITSVDLPSAFHEAQRLTPDRLVVVLVGDRAQIEPGLLKKGLKVLAAPERFTE
jgi:hypothetical protein